MKKKRKKLTIYEWARTDKYYTFDYFEKIAYAFYLLDISPYKGYTGFDSFPRTYQQIDAIINEHARNLHGKETTR